MSDDFDPTLKISTAIAKSIDIEPLKQRITIEFSDGGNKEAPPLGMAMITFGHDGVEPITCRADDKRLGLSDEYQQVLASLCKIGCGVLTSNE